MYTTVDGVTFPTGLVKKMPAGDLQLQMCYMKDMDIRDDDVIICSYPKTGSHWLWEVVSMVRKETADYDTKVKENVMPDYQTPEGIAKIPSPRVMNTHFLPRHLPAGITEKKCKIIHVMRNPKDVVVSLFHMSRTLAGFFETDSTEQFSQHFNFYMNPEIGSPCSIFEYYKEYESFRKDNPDQHVLNVYYESMKKQPAVEIKRIAEFMGQTLHESLIKEIAIKCEFSNLKQANADVKGGKLMPGKSVFAYRKGVIGDWKNHFTVADNEAYDQLIDSQFKDTGLVFQYE